MVFRAVMVAGVCVKDRIRAGDRPILQSFDAEV
jgi:hypothetical protein